MNTKPMKKYLLLACLMAFASSQIIAQKKPNIIVILMDDLGYGDLSSYGASQYQTPNLDQMAKDELGSLISCPHRPFVVRHGPAF